MKWSQIDRYHIESEQGYRVSKTFVVGKVIYTAWPPTGEPIKYSRGPKGVDRCKKECEKHYEKKKPNATHNR